MQTSEELRLVIACDFYDCCSIGKKTTELQYAIVHWHKWNTDCKDLESTLIKTSYDIEPVELEQCEQR